MSSDEIEAEIEAKALQSADWATAWALLVIAGKLDELAEGMQRTASALEALEPPQ